MKEGKEETIGRHECPENEFREDREEGSRALSRPVPHPSSSWQAHKSGFYGQRSRVGRFFTFTLYILPVGFRLQWKAPLGAWYCDLDLPRAPGVRQKKLKAVTLGCSAGVPPAVAGVSRSHQERAGRMPTPQRAGRPRYFVRKVLPSTFVSRSRARTQRIYYFRSASV